MVKIVSFLFLFSLSSATGLGLSAPQTDEVAIRKGATPIPNGDARSAEDLTLENGRIAVSFAVESRPPWGVAKGGILDLSIIRDGEYSEDLASLIDFMPDNWSSWPTTYQEVSIEENSPERGIIRVERDWHNVILETTFTLERGETIIHVSTEMTNRGDHTHEDILSGYVLWADGGYFFNRPGAVNGDTGDAQTDWTASYEKDWALVFHAPFADRVAYGGQDQYKNHTLPPGKSVSFEGWIQVIDDGSLKPALDFETNRKNLLNGTLSGKIQTDDGAIIQESLVVIEQDGAPYVWTTSSAGSYEISLPEGKYTAYAIAENHSASSEFLVSVPAGKTIRHNFTDLRKPGEIQFQVSDSATGEPLDAWIKFTEGPNQPVEYLGRSMVFTDLTRQGQLTLPVAPGEYAIEAGSGAGFVSEPVSKNLTIKPEHPASAELAISRKFKPTEKNWYSADLHHHSDILDGSTPVPAVLQAQLSAGLDFAFLSDHDSGENHFLMDSLAAERNVPFIPSMEISPSWGHFNVFPIDLGASLTIDPSTATATEIIDDAKKMGAGVVSVNHPYISYGYFHSLEEETATGGFDPRVNLMELNIGDDFELIFERLYEFWNSGIRIFLAAGSDTHDVWTGDTGQIRMMVNIPGKPTAESFSRNLKNGHAYATEGPLMEPEILFGTQHRIQPGQSGELSFTLQSVHGLSSVKLIRNGEVAETIDLKNAGKETRASFQVQPDQESWYAVIVADMEGKKAYSNPIWVTPAGTEF